MNNAIYILTLYVLIRFVTCFHLVVVLSALSASFSVIMTEK